jgi:hypothetical protein
MKSLLEKSSVERVIWPKKNALDYSAYNQFAIHFFAIFSRIDKRIEAIKFPMVLNLNVIRSNVPYYLHFEYVSYLSFVV